MRTSVLILESVEDVDVGRGDPPALYVNRKTLPTENLLEDTDGLLRPPFRSVLSGAVAGCDRFLLTAALL